MDNFDFNLRNLTISNSLQGIARRLHQRSHRLAGSSRLARPSRSSRRLAAVAAVLRGWDAADSGQRSRLFAGIFEQLEAEALPEGTIRVVAVPREAWKPFFESLVLGAGDGGCRPQYQAPR